LQTAHEQLECHFFFAVSVQSILLPVDSGIAGELRFSSPR
jgi:hypothetical protein